MWPCSPGSVAGVVVASLVAVLSTARPACVGALAGAGVTLLVLATGFAIVDLVAGLMPALSLVVALLTYTLQVVLLAAAAGRARAAPTTSSRRSTPRWFAGGVIAVALAWTVCLVVHAMHARDPALRPARRGPGRAARCRGARRWSER